MTRGVKSVNKTGIEYLDYTWNPIAMRCTPVSEGCANCWHLAVADRLAVNPRVEAFIQGCMDGSFDPCLVPERINQPQGVKKSSRIGVQFMGDLFHEDIRHFMIDDVFEAMLQAPQHIYIVLTKRPKAMYDWADSTGNRAELIEKTGAWLGVTAENQKRADERIPILLSIPAAVHFVSFEPLLSHINMHQCGAISWGPCGGGGESGPVEYDGMAKIDWAVCAPETGPRRRPYDIEWVRGLKNQCINFGVPFFLKHLFDGNKKVTTPQLDGEIWNQYPKTGE